MSKKSIITRSSGGFTLIEIAIAITIVSLLIIPAIKMYENWQNQSRLAVNQQRLDAIRQALSNYMNIYGRLPCPASFIAQPRDLNFGREIVPQCLDPDSRPDKIKIYTPDGKNTFAATGRSTPKQNPPINPDIIIGSVPVRDLALPDSLRADAWDHLFTYAVSASETTTQGNREGIIDVVDEFGHTVLPYAADRTSTGTALYVLIDHGKDGKGAYPAHPGAAVTMPPVPCGSAAGLDNLNCSFEAKPASPFAFRSAPFGNRTGSGWFDDTVVFYAQLNSVFPALTATPAPLTVNTPPQQSATPAPQQPDENQLNAQEQQLLQQQLNNLPQLNEQMNELRQQLEQQRNP